MKIGFIISMYDEIGKVKETIKVVKRKNCPVIVIQSDPKIQNEILNHELADHYELLEDVAGNKEQYKDERSHMDRGTTIPSYALSRNYSHGFTAAAKFDVDWWIATTSVIAATPRNSNASLPVIQPSVANEPSSA